MNKAITLQSILNVMFYGSLTSLCRNSENKFTAGVQLNGNIRFYITVILEDGSLHFQHRVTPDFSKVFTLEDYSTMTLTALSKTGNMLLDNLACLYKTDREINKTNKLFIPFKE